MKINPVKPERDILEKAVNILRAGGVIGYPTDTSYGLGADPYNFSAIEKIKRLKGRDANKPILLIINNQEQLKNIVQNISDAGHKLMDNFWPGPLTLIFEATPDFCKTPVGESGKIGIRLPDNIIARELAGILQKPITATSANPSGESSPYSSAKVREYFQDRLDLIIDGGVQERKLDSTIIDVSEKIPRLIRAGALELDKLLECLPILDNLLVDI